LDSGKNLIECPCQQGLRSPNRGKMNQTQSREPGRELINQEDIHVSLPLRNPHHGLKEKMKALTLLYEQQKQASAALRSKPSRPPEEHRFTTHPSVELIGKKDRRRRQGVKVRGKCQVEHRAGKIS
jgi:hypothetical protein